MPKKEIDYSKACVYRLIYNDINYYVGSTTNMSKRKAQHKRGCYNESNKDYNYPLYKFIRDNEGFDNWVMILIQAYPDCKTSDELRMYERQHYEVLRPVLNVNRPIVTKEEIMSESRERNRIVRLENPEQIKEWRANNVEHLKNYRVKYRIENADKIKEYKDSQKEIISINGKKYREENADKIKERDSIRGICECGQEINLRRKYSHIKSQCHIKKMSETV